MKVGDIVERVLNAGGKIVPMMKLKITAITEDRVICGDWQFDKRTGAEIDEDLGWGPEATGTYIRELMN